MFGFNRTRPVPPPDPAPPAPAPLIRSVDEVLFYRGTIRLRGWAFCPGRQIAGVALRGTKGETVALDGYGSPSPDVAAAHDGAFPEAGACRFSFVAPWRRADAIPGAALVFTLDDGTEREVSGLTQSPAPLQASVNAASFVRGRLHLAGWAFCPGQSIVGVALVQPDGGRTKLSGYGSSSPDVLAFHPGDEEAARCRFDFDAPLADAADLPALRLEFTLEDGSTRAVAGLEQTPAPLQWSLGQVHHLRGELLLDGWAFCPGQQVVEAMLVRADGERVRVENHGLPSPDVARLHPDEPEAARCRFTLRTPLADAAEIPTLRLVFTLDDGTTREAGGLEQTPMPLDWSAGEASLLRGRLHLSVWAFCRGRRIVQAGLIRPDGTRTNFDESRLPSPDVAALHPDKPEAGYCRFTLTMPLASADDIPALRLVFTLDDGTTREATGLAQTPVGLLWSAGRVNLVRGKLILEGWAFCPERHIAGIMLVHRGGERVRLDNYGLPSPDVERLHPAEPEAAHCRFTLTTPLASADDIPGLRLVFTLDDGTPREVGGFAQTPTALIWSPMEAHLLRSDLHLAVWAFCPGREIVRAMVIRADGMRTEFSGSSLPSADVAQLHPDEPAAVRCRFTLTMPLSDPAEIPDLRLEFTLDDGTIREAGGLERTPPPLLWSPIQLHHLRGRLILDGWAFCPGQRIIRAEWRDRRGAAQALDHYGLPSPEVAKLHADEPAAAHCRFTLHTTLADPTDIPHLRLVFILDDGTTREVAGLKERPLPITWAAKEVYRAHGRLHLNGWAFCPGRRVVGAGLHKASGEYLACDNLELSSADVARLHPDEPAAAHCGFALTTALAETESISGLRLVFTLDDGSTREVHGLEQTPTPLKWSASQVNVLRGELHLDGWAFCPGQEIVAAEIIRADGTRTAFDGYGLPSPDVAKLHPDEPGAARCRFALNTVMDDPSEIPAVRLRFTLKDGTRRETTGLKQTLVHLQWSVNHVTFYRGTVHVSGWALCPGSRVVAAGLRRGNGAYTALEGHGLRSPDVLEIHPTEPEAAHCGFNLSLKLEDAAEVPALTLVFTLDDGSQREVAHLVQKRLDKDPYHALQKRFFDLLEEQKTGTVLEVGSRARSGNVRQGLLPDGFEYVGMDIVPGENVDVVGDAHLLGETFPPESFDAVFSVSVFEHLLMPWKAVLEIGKVLKVGGLVLVATHQSFPLHETPWDFFRFSDQAWHGLFNAATGFEIVQTALGEPVSVVPHLLHRTMIGLEGVPAFIGSVVLARKVGESSLRWDVDIKNLLDTMYPH